jgi:stage II sporulation protein D
MRFVLPILLLCSLTARADNVRVAVARGALLRVDGHALVVKARADGKGTPATSPLTLELVGPFISTGGQLESTLFIEDATGEITIDGVPLIGTAEIIVDKGALLAIDSVELERYVASVVGSEMPPDWPEGALQAQAIATRTYVLQKQRGEHPGVPYDVEATVISQVYRGRRSLAPGSVAAALATAGKVLRFEGRLVEAFFFGSCVGTTENAQDAFGHAAPYLKPVPCELASDAPGAAWTRQVSLESATKLLQAAGALRGDLKAVEIQSRTATGRVATARLIGPEGAHVVTGTELRRFLGYATLPSLDLTVRKVGGALVFSGHGAGHGVGLCQWCAQGMAARGVQAEAILKHFYPGATIGLFNEIDVPAAKP